MEYAANNIRFNTVSPGNINTPMHAKNTHAALAKFHPLGRMGEISDIAKSATSPAFRFCLLAASALRAARCSVNHMLSFSR